MKKLFHFFKIALCVPLFLGFLSNSLFGQVQVVSPTGATLNKIVSQSSIQTGMQFSYTIFYSLPAGSTGITISDLVPAPLIVDNVIVNATCGTAPVVTPTSFPASNSGGTLVTYSLASVPTACSGTFQILAHFPAGTTCDGTVVRNRACMNGKTPFGGITDLCTNYVTTTAIATDPWKVFKQSIGTSYLGGACPNVTYSDIVNYQIRVSKTPGIYGFLNLNDAVVNDQLPAGATIVPGSLSTTYGSATIVAGNILRWELGVGGTPRPVMSATQIYNDAYLNVKIQYPPLTISACFTNTATLTGNLGSQTNGAWCGQHTDASSIQVRRERLIDQPPPPTAQLIKWISQLSGNTVGCTGKFNIRVYNNGTLPLSGVNFSDNFAGLGITVNSVNIVNNSGGSPINSIGLYVNGSTAPAATFNAPNATSGNAPFTTPPINSIKIVRNGAALAVGGYIQCEVAFTITTASGTITNCATTTTTGITPATACAQFGAYPPAPKACVYKDICSPQQSYVLDDIITYRLRVQNIGSSPIAAGATITDVLNPNLTIMGSPIYYTSSTYNPACGGVGSTPWTGVTHTVSGNNLSWTLPAIASDCAAFLYPNCGFTGTVGIPFYFIEFQARVKPDAGLGTVFNNFSIQGGGLTGSTTSNTVPITIAGTHGFVTTKQVSKALDGTGYANSIVSAQNTQIAYRLNMKNTGTASFNNILMIDKLPQNNALATADYFMLPFPCISRSSEFSTRAIGTISSSLLIPPLTGLKYDNGIDIKTLIQFGVSCGLNPPAWSLTVPTPAVGSQNLKLEYGSTTFLPPNTGNVLNYDFKALVDANAQNNQKACNTFAAKATGKYIVNGADVFQPLGATESNTACVTVNRVLSCCDKTQIVPTDAACCSKLKIEPECSIKNVKVTLTGGTFTSLNWTICSPAPLPASYLNLTTCTLTPTTACYSTVIDACFKSTTATGSVTVTYLVTFADGTTCTRSEVKKCCCVPIINKIPTTACAGVGIPFTASTLGCAFTNGKWDFGDSNSGVLNTSIALSATHIYNTAGTYTATFTYTNACGTFSLKFTIVITKCPCAVKPCLGFSTNRLAVTFSSLGTTTSVPALYPIVAYHWDFGDGTFSNLANPTHTYAAVGTYTVCLTVYADDGSGICNCNETVCTKILVSTGPNASGNSCKETPTTPSESLIDPSTSTSTQSSESLKMTAFPNPSDNTVTIGFGKQLSDTEGGVSQLEIYNLQGQLVKEQTVEGGIDETKVSLKQFPVGTYLISLRQNGQIMSTVKVTKN